MVSMKVLSTEERTRIVACLVEGMSIRAICRITGAAKGTVLKLVEDLGLACEQFHDRAVHGVAAKRVQVDELWTFVHARARTIKRDPSIKGIDGAGDVWTWTAMDADTKLMVTWFVGEKGLESAGPFMHDLASRVSGRLQLTSDGHGPYLAAVSVVFGDNVDFAQLIKVYGNVHQQGRVGTAPAECIGTETKVRIGNPDPQHISTSFVERQNLTVRMHQRRFTRLTNAFSKKKYNLCMSLAIHYVYYNFCRIHQTLKVTPAMAAGLADHAWELSELVGLLEAKERAVIGTAANKRGPYRKRGQISE